MSGARTFDRMLCRSEPRRFAVMKTDDDRRQVFGWASVAVTAAGQPVVDCQDDVIEPEELEKAAYDFAENYRTAGDAHERCGVGVLIESAVFTKEKTAANPICMVSGGKSSGPAGPAPFAKGAGSKPYAIFEI